MTNHTGASLERQTFNPDLARIGIDSLNASGANVVLLYGKDGDKSGKRPMLPGWLKEGAKTEDALRHLFAADRPRLAGIGIVPHSIGAVVFDFDAGEWNYIVEAHMPGLLVPTRPGRAHAYYSDCGLYIRKRNFGTGERCHFAFDGHGDVKGEVISATGMVKIHTQNALSDLAQATQCRAIKARPFPMHCLLYTSPSPRD